MAYTLPVFNLPVSIWWPDAAMANDPPTDSADVQTMGQLRYPRRNYQVPDINDSAAQHVTSAVIGLVRMYLAVPRGTDIRGSRLIGGTRFSGWVQVPTGGVRWYVVNSVEDVAAGFENEYRQAVIYLWNQRDIDPLPSITDELP
jgi:hypothetical protein